MVAGALLALVCAQGPYQPPPGAVLLDRVVAVVEREVITQSELDRAARVHLARQGIGLGAMKVPLDAALLGAVLNLLIAEELVVQDGRRRQRFPEDDAQVTRQVAALRGTFRSEAEFGEFLKQLQLSEQDLVDMVRREVRVDLLIREQGQVPVPSEADVRAFMATQPDGGMDAGAFTRAREQLHAQRRDDAIAAWIQGLRERSAVHVPSPPEPR